MENINENVLDLIDHIDSGDAMEAEKVFNNILQSRVDELLDAYKQDVATNMFNTEECADCEEQVDEALKGNQHKIDANKNGKIDAHDFKLLRGRKTPKTERMDRALAKRVENNKKMKEEVEQVDEISKQTLSAYIKKAGPQVGDLENKHGLTSNVAMKRRRGVTRASVNYLKKDLADLRKEEVELDEAAYSAKMARAGKDIGKPGKMFSKIATKAARKYGKERGAKIAGAVLAKLRKKGK